MGTLYPNTFESAKFCSVNDSLANPDIFRVLPECFAPEKFKVFWMKGQVLHRARGHLKEPALP